MSNMESGGVLRLLVVAGGLALSMCGAQGPPPATPASATAVEGERPAGEGKGEPAADMAAAPAPPAPVPAEAPPATARAAPEAASQSSAEGPPSRMERREARADFDRARGELESAAHDCALACKALASMERAVVRLCSLVELPDDRRRCDDVKKRLLEARDRVRVACGGCPGGPSVRRNDPIPTE